MRKLLFSAAASAIVLSVVLFLAFCLFEIFPGLLAPLPVDNIRYYAQKKRFEPDSTLVFVPRKAPPSTDEYRYNGDLYREEYGIPPPAIEFRSSWSVQGFRTNSSAPPFDVVLIGDSFLEFGERNDNTLSEQLKSISGLRTCNLGRAWYGPDQYLEVLRRTALGLKPKASLLCFFSGNDMQDIQQYAAWAAGGDYYHFVLDHRSFASRLFIAASDTFDALKGAWPGVAEVSRLGLYGNPGRPAHPDIAIVRLAGREVPMRFVYWNRPLQAEYLLAEREWKHLGGLLREYRDTCRIHSISSIAVYIPHASEVYGRLIDAHSGENVMKRLPQQLDHMDTSIEAFRRICTELDLPLVDLVPGFREAAREGALLYYPFDTHWTAEGRKLAAQAIAERLR